MPGLIPNFPYNGVVTVNRVILKSGYTVDDLQERVALLCENVKTYHSTTGLVLKTMKSLTAVIPSNHYF